MLLCVFMLLLLKQQINQIYIITYYCDCITASPLAVSTATLTVPVTTRGLTFGPLC